MATPHYYTSLGEFRGLFATGNPVLTYHKVGPRPRGARLKGLYVSPALFARQLGELRAAGYRSGPLAESAGPAQAGRVVLTFDDGFVNVLAHALAPLRSNGFSAIQFLVADLLGKTNEWEAAAGERTEPLMDVAQVREWLAAGHAIGSHTRTHPFLTQLSRDAAREEISASKKKLEDLFGRAVEHFCYPYGDWNPAVRDLVIAAGYRTACTTNAGVNSTADSPFELKRITARYRSRSLRNLVAWVRGRWPRPSAPDR
jgi:peptidoglycan/xylan/chitin deacetylase (PgdA/CDA1 family)